MKPAKIIDSTETIKHGHLFSFKQHWTSYGTQKNDEVLSPPVAADSTSGSEEEGGKRSAGVLAGEAGRSG